ncbi:MAG: hypothetical protein CFE44_09285 [Burkholderiales bacterium PBB4]|nr:MAG: hypothetical protein CFE44_09285 [Burkholderiales bacterium PBB4]
MRRTLLLVLLTLVACAQQTRIVPPDGAPTAELNDWIDTDEDGQNPRVFAALSINGTQIPNAVQNVQRVGFGAGAAAFPLMVVRPIEAKATTVKVIGRHLVNAPIGEIFRRAKGKFQEIEGTITFTPKPDVVYRVAGILSAQKSEIWIEESESRVRVSESITKSGDA